LHLTILKKKPGSLKEFIEFWAQFYDEGKYPDSMYTANLNINGKLQKDNIIPLLNGKTANPYPKPRKISQTK
jgi:hypothetical protein